MGSDELTQAIRAAIKAANPETVLVLDGLVIVEVLHSGDSSPQLRTVRIGVPTSWQVAGLLAAARMMNDDYLRAGWVEDE